MAGPHAGNVGAWPVAARQPSRTSYKYSHTQQSIDIIN